MKSSISDKICVFQPYIDIAQKVQVDKYFTPFDHTENPNPDLREYLILEKIYQDLDKIDAQYVGLLSLKFPQKSLVTGLDVINTINNNPGHDVYLFNPFPQNNGMFYNVWDQGEFGHPNITALTQDALDGSSQSIELMALGRGVAKTVYCNFWVATKAFWHDYMSFLLSVGQFMLSQPDKYLSITNYVLGDMPIFTFIVERLITTYLMSRDHISCFSYKYADQMLPKLIHSEYEAALYERLAGVINRFDDRYGENWPMNVLQEFKKIRHDVCIETQKLGLSVKNRY